MNITEFIKLLSKALEKIYAPSTAYHNAWVLAEKLFDTSHAALVAKKDITLSEEQKKQLQEWLKQLLEDHKPLQYLLGSVPFLDATILVKPPVLIPRPETEEWCELFIKTMQKSNIPPHSLLDLCTGSGCIAIAFAKTLSKVQVYAVDCASPALVLARENAVLNNVVISFYESDLYKDLPAGIDFDVIVVNPPYIDPACWKNLDPHIREWEDKNALVAKNKGLALIEKIVYKAPAFLTKKAKDYPCLWIEIGYDQGKVVTKIFEEAGFYKVRILKDSSGNDRVVTGWYGERV